MISKATTVYGYLARLPENKRSEIIKIRNLILKNLPKGYKEVMQYGMISYVIPLKKFPNTYNKKPLAYISLASQKNYFSLYHMGLYSDPDKMDWFKSELEKNNINLNMGKSCIRFKNADELPLKLIAKSIKKTPPDKLISLYQKSRTK